MEEVKGLVVALTGHRDLDEDDANDKLVPILADVLVTEGDRPVKFLSGAARGFDLMAAEEVVKFRDENKAPWKLCLYIPFDGHIALWGDEDIKRFINLKAKADEVVIVGEDVSNVSYLVRNRAMVDIADEVIAYWDGGSSGTGYTVNYAIEQNKPVCWISPASSDIVMLP